MLHAGSPLNPLWEGKTLDFVSDWEDLPDGEWLENDEHGVHWYLTNDGAHWFSTEDGYRLWIEDGDVPQDEVDESIYHEQEEDDDSTEPEDDEHAGPVPRLSAGTTLLSMSLALFVLAWTLFITISSTDYNLDRYTSGSPIIAPEIDRAMVDGLELHQTLNMVTLVFAGVAVGIGCMSLLKKTPWWAVVASQAALLTVLTLASRAAFSAEQARWDACDPSVYYCHQMEPESVFTVHSLYPAILIAFSLLYIFNQSMKAWANVDQQEESEFEGDIQLFSKSAPRLGGFPALIGLFMSLTVASFTHFFVIPATDDNISTFGGSLTAQGELFQSVQGFNVLVLNVTVLVMVISLLTLIKKIPWWALPVSILPLIALQFMAIGESQFNGLLAFEQDPFYSSACSMLAIVIIGISAFRTMADHDWEEDDEDYGGYDDVGKKNYYEFYGDEEEDYEWRGKIKTVAMACALLFAGIGGFFAVQFTLGATDDPAFQIRDANGVLSNGSDDELVVIDMLDKTNAYSEETLKVSLKINDEESVDCSWKRQVYCTFVYLEIFEDRGLTAMESILISEGGLNWCSGAADESCTVTAHLTQVRNEEDEDMQITVQTTDLGTYTLKVA